MLAPFASDALDALFPFAPFPSSVSDDRLLFFYPFAPSFLSSNSCILRRTSSFFVSEVGVDPVTTLCYQFAGGRSGMGVDEVEKCHRFDEMRFIEIDEA